jgi:hypothetical protein
MIRPLIVVLCLTFLAGTGLAQEHTPDATTLLLLHCNGSLTGAAGETPVASAGTSFAGGIFGQGVQLPAGCQLTYAAANNIAAPQGTLEFWLRPNWNGNDGQDHLVLTWGTWGGILTGKDGGNFWRIIVNRYGPNGSQERGTGIPVGGEWLANQWHHCAFTWNATRVQAYVDGALRAEANVGFNLPAIPSTTFQIGGEGTNASLGGTLDELRISSNVRTAAEVLESYARGLTITTLAVTPDPVVVAEGWTVTPDVAATAAGGVVLAVPPASCAWVVADTTIAKVNLAGQIVGRHLGATTATATWHGAADAVQVQVQASLPAPANPHATGYCTTAYVTWDPVVGASLVGYEVERRPAGGAFAVVKRVLSRANFTDSGLTPGQTYEYRVIGIDARGSRISAPSSVCATTLQANLAGLSRHKNIEILFAIYTSGYSQDEISRFIEGAKKGMAFYWRTTEGNLNFDPTFLLVDASLPADIWGPEVEADLRDRGVQDDQYDAAYLIGNGLAGCLSPYWVFGSTIGALGTICRVPYPEKVAGVDYSLTWTFTHEIHHVLEGMDYCTGDVTPPVYFCHFPWTYPDPIGGTGVHIDWAAHYDGIAVANRLYGDNWLLYPAPYDQILECADADGDGLPDADVRVPMDEARFLSLASRPDTDFDGLGDLAEYTRYNFRGTDPNLPDTDGDGELDGADHQPLYKVAANLPLLPAAPAIDGVIEPAWPLLMPGYYYTTDASPFTLETYAGWTDEGLYLAFASNVRLRFKVSIDGSGEDGRFESPVRHVEGATDTDNPDNKYNHIGDTWGDGNHIYFSQGVNTVEVYDRGPIPGAQIASSFAGGIYRTEVRLPAALPGGAGLTWYPAGPGTPTTQGLTLTGGHVIGLNVTMSRFETNEGEEFPYQWGSGGYLYTSLFETHSYVDFVLGGGGIAVPDAGDLPRVTQLESVAPNPFNPQTTIRFALATASDVTLTVYDLAGRRVATLVDEPLAAGRYEATFDGRRCASGIYLCRLQAGGHTSVQRMALVK